MKYARLAGLATVVVGLINVPGIQADMDRAEWFLVFPKQVARCSMVLRLSSMSNPSRHWTARWHRIRGTALSELERNYKGRWQLPHPRKLLNSNNKRNRALRGKIQVEREQVASRNLTRNTKPTL